MGSPTGACGLACEHQTLHLHLTYQKTPRTPCSRMLARSIGGPGGCLGADTIQRALARRRRPYSGWLKTSGSATVKSACLLEEPFWHALKEIVAAQSTSMARQIRKIDTERRERVHKNLSSAVRLFIRDHHRNRCGFSAQFGRTSTHRPPRPHALHFTRSLNHGTGVSPG